MEEKDKASFTLKIGREFKYVPFKNERYVFWIKIAKIVATTAIGLTVLWILLQLILNQLMNELIAWTISLLTFICLVGIHCVSEQIPIIPEEENQTN